MITLGQLLGKFITSNPQILVMVTRKVEAGSLVEVKDIKISMTDDKTSVLVLTI